MNAELSETVDQQPVTRTLLASDLVDSTRWVSELGDAQAAELFRQHDRTSRRLLQEKGGREIDKTDGFLLLFDEAEPAVRYALAYHDALQKLSENLPRPLTSRVGIHVGDVRLWENPAEEVERGAKPLEVEGLAKSVVARVMSLAGARQTLLTRNAFERARRTVDSDGTRKLRWLAHGDYLLKWVEDPIEIFEVGFRGSAPLEAPADSREGAASLRQRASPGLAPCQRSGHHGTDGLAPGGSPRRRRHR